MGFNVCLLVRTVSLKLPHEADITCCRVGPRREGQLVVGSSYIYTSTPWPLLFWLDARGGEYAFRTLLNRTGLASL